MKNHNVLDIACFIINYCNDNDLEINNLRLNKLIYFAQGNYMSLYDDILFEDKFEAWHYGPTLPIVFKEFSKYGSHSIPHTDEYFWYNSDLGMYEILPFNQDILSQDIRELLVEVIKLCAEYDTYDLVDKSCKQKGWLDAYNKDNSCLMDNNIIKETFK